MKKPPQELIAEHYESCLRQHGDSPQGVDWPNKRDALIRYRTMLEVTDGRSADGKCSVLDFGCGTGALLQYIRGRRLARYDYSGLDISKEFVGVASGKFPGNRFYCLDVFDGTGVLPTFDYIIMNGVFTEKLNVPYVEMLEYMERLIGLMFEKCSKGMAFNVMSKHVDWERDDLFHVPFDEMATVLRRSLSRNFVFRSDYGLYEYTVYVYRDPPNKL